MLIILGKQHQNTIKNDMLVQRCCSFILLTLFAFKWQQWKWHNAQCLQIMVFSKEESSDAKFEFWCKVFLNWKDITLKPSWLPNLGLIQKCVYKTAVCDLKQRLFVWHMGKCITKQSTKLLNSGESSYMHAGKRRDITAKLKRLFFQSHHPTQPALFQSHHQSTAEIVLRFIPFPSLLFKSK